MKHWEDWRLIDAIARGGTLAQAARDLDIDYSTVHRRLKSIEKQVGARLFERTRSSCSPTTAGERAIAAATQAREAFDDALLDIAGDDARLTGTIRFTSFGSLAQWVLMPILARFHEVYPDIRVELVESNAALNLTRREADVALRFTRKPPDNLIGIRVGRADSAAYAAADYLSRNPDRHLGELDWIVPVPDVVLPEETQWHQRHVPASRHVLHTSSGLAGLAAAHAGLGACILICYLGGAGGLTRISPPIPELAADLWLLTHPSLRQVARIRAFVDFLKRELREKAPLLQGETGPVDLRGPRE